MERIDADAVIAELCETLAELSAVSPAPMAGSHAR